ncbi:hypothetical protein AALP_AA3G303400 [Arabis alpina]|uniref:Uncharacterized protein n=1 Tax=Arabis alpina TaxID=50452 RepID=A0A087HCP8_ARAAL|nr:hypothetical protein AALP_AA3G303400 [Arabis alpina]
MLWDCIKRNSKCLFLQNLLSDQNRRVMSRLSPAVYIEISEFQWQFVLWRRYVPLHLRM